MATADKLTKLTQTKTAIRSAINGKGQIVAVGDKFSAYASKITAIETEKVYPAFRYIRSSQKGGWITNLEEFRTWTELQVYKNGINIALNKPVSMGPGLLASLPGSENRLVDNGFGEYVAIMSNDDLTDDEYTYAQVDLGSVVTADGILLSLNPDQEGTGYNKAFHKLEVSEDNQNWHTIYDTEISGTYLETDGGMLFALKDKFQSFASGLKTARGNFTPTSTNQTTTINNLSFTPSIILVRETTQSDSTKDSFVYASKEMMDTDNDLAISLTTKIPASTNGDAISIITNGFTVETYAKDVQYNWIAIE